MFTGFWCALVKLELKFGANSNAYHKNALVATATETKHEQDFRCIHREEPKLQKPKHKGLLNCKEVEGSENIMGNDKAEHFSFMVI